MAAAETSTEAVAVERVGVVGCGLMGSGIAEVCAKAGVDVVVREVDADAMAAGRSRLEGSLQRGRLSEEEQAAALSRMHYTTDLGDMADRQLVIEAVTESEPAKVEVFATLAHLVS